MHSGWMYLLLTKGVLPKMATKYLVLILAVLSWPLLGPICKVVHVKLSL